MINELYTALLTKVTRYGVSRIILPPIDEQPLTCVGPLAYLGSWDVRFA
jgi:hypothetical protein